MSLHRLSAEGNKNKFHIYWEKGVGGGTMSVSYGGLALSEIQNSLSYTDIEHNCSWQKTEQFLHNGFISQSIFIMNTSYF
jgi:hypothetical protein